MTPCQKLLKKEGPKSLEDNGTAYRCKQVGSWSSASGLFIGALMKIQSQVFPLECSLSTQVLLRNPKISQLHLNKAWTVQKLQGGLKACNKYPHYIILVLGGCRRSLHAWSQTSLQCLIVSIVFGMVSMIQVPLVILGDPAYSGCATMVHETLCEKSTYYT